MTSRSGQVSFCALGTTAVVFVADDAALPDARAVCECVIAEVDRACSRFRDDSDLVRVNTFAGEHVAVSPWLVDALDVALYGARITDGLVDPTVGTAMRAIGYDCDFAQIATEGPSLRVAVRSVPGWRWIDIDRARGSVGVPKGVELDLGATAKAWCADRAARAAAEVTGVGVVVGLGGDLSVAGAIPRCGWQVRIADDHRASIDEPGGQTVSIFGGGVATSGTSVRRWTRGTRSLHHVVDPSTGSPASEHWRTVSVAAASCVDANIASTAAIVLGADASAWLGQRRLPARLVDANGDVSVVGGWPSE